MMDAPPLLDTSPMFEPLTIRGMTLRNRFVMPGMQRGWCRDGKPQPNLAEYYRKRAAGGTALIISEGSAVDHPTSTQGERYGWISESTRDGWQACVNAVRDAGGHFFLQLWHEGAIRTEGGDGPRAAHPTLSPSGLARPGQPAGRAATLEELMEIKDAFVQAALLAEDIGTSGVEIHACHGYLLDQFLWGGTNRRTDGYGGADIAHRVRFPAEIVAAIRAVVSEDFVISFRFSQWKEIDYDARVAATPEELAIMLTTLRDAGVDVFHASARRFWTPEWPESDLGIAGWCRRLGGLPVTAVGSVGLDVDIMDNFSGQEAHSSGHGSFVEMLRRFERGDFDLMSVGRSQIGDPQWVEKVRAGAIDDIRIFARDDLLGEGLDRHGDAA